jgi:class 3 adenylate cyclase
MPTSTVLAPRHRSSHQGGDTPPSATRRLAQQTLAAASPRDATGRDVTRTSNDDPRAAARPGLRLIPGDADRFITTILFTDIVGSTLTAARLGDHRWCDLLAAHLADSRLEVSHGGGRVIGTTGDGMLAIFDAPTRAVRTAMAIRAAACRRGLGVRAGVHAGECRRTADGVSGIAVHIASRICALAAADEILTTSTVRGLVIGSTLSFESRGLRRLRGVPGRWAVYRASDVG